MNSMGERMDELNDEADALAIIGMAGRFPGAGTVAEFWQTLRSGQDALTRWDATELEAPDGSEVETPDYVPVKGYLPGASRFREDLFGVSAAEAPILDPQIRLLLEAAWAALDDAGVPTSPDDPADVGVFVSMATSEHALAAQTDRALARRLGALQVKLLTDKDFAATWLSYRLNLAGPGVTVQTACSSSLVAVHQAAISVLLGECRVALAGGVCLDSTRRVGYRYVEGGIGSRAGAVRPFDADSDGAVGGNGVGLIVLKRLADALADGDRVDAVLLGSAIGNDGRGKVGFTAPGVDGHARVIAAAWQNADRDLAEIGYFEAHGTGTRLGDPIEVAAFAQACSTLRARPDAVIGSVKGVIGHLDTAAGIAGVIKAVCMLRARQLVATPGLRTPDPVLDLAGRGLRIQSETTDFPAERAMYVGVSSLGIGGTNAHVVLGEAPSRARQEDRPGLHLLPFSVHTTHDLPAYTRPMSRAVAVATSLDEVASTLQTGRRELGVRAFVVAGSTEEAAAELAAGRAPRSAGAGQVGFLFPGQTARYRGLGTAMYERFPAFRRALDSFAAVLGGYGIDPLADHDLAGTDHWQPTIVAHQLALVQLLQDHGLRPTAVAGHSLGEFTAAVALGVFEPEDD
jgi:acyl transferase domain-containing protein